MKERRARVLIIGAGDMARRIAAGLGATERVGAIAIAGLAAGEGEALAGLVASTTDAACRFLACDCTGEEVVAGVLAETRPDVVVQCASLLSPWALGGRSDTVARAVQAGGLGVALPMQLPVLLATMRAVRATGFAGPVANLSFPDVTNPIMARLGLAPTCGLGNVTMQQLRVRGALRARLGPGAELPLTRLLGHHTQVYDVLQARLPADASARVRVHVGEDGARDDELAYTGHPFAPGIRYNAVTAAAVVATVLALLPGAGPTRISVPAPSGLPGGYPVRIAGGAVELDLPPGVDLDEAVAWQSALGRRDGIEAIASDGTATFSASAHAAVDGIAPWLTEPLHPDAALERAGRLRTLLAR